MSAAPEVPSLRVAPRNERAIRRAGDYVLYWMIAARRTRSSFALEHALACAARLQKPLVVLEALRAGHRFASARLHRFVLDGMRDQAESFARAGVRYVPYVEPRAGAGRGLLEALARRACLVVTDELPSYFLPRMVAAAAAKLDVRLETVDGNGLLPLRATEHAFPTAYAFRRFLQKHLPAHLARAPLEEPLELAATIPREAWIAPEIEERWPTAPRALIDGDEALLAALEIDASVRPVALAGGERAARAAAIEFVRARLPRYADERNDPDLDAGSRLSAWLHFGHLGVHEVLREVAKLEGWDPSSVATTATGKKEGWWSMGASAEAFLDQLVTWRELGHVFAFHRDDHDRYESLPDWARATLDAHASDRREHVYSLAELADSRTHDRLWNAAQTQLREEGRIHNYMRMLWGKKIVEWTAHPRDALAAMIELNDRLALDGRDPNSYSGIFWVLGRFDRPWGPKRKVFGTVRYMSSASTERKLDVDRYVARWSRSATGLFD